MLRSAIVRRTTRQLFWFSRASRPVVAADSRYRGILTLIGAGVLVLLCKGTVNAQAPIRIGASMGLTGAYAQFGQTIQRGYQLCLKHANEKGGVPGRKLELTIVDDKSDNATAVAIVWPEELAADRPRFPPPPWS